jgi:hypothetical protein
MNLKQLSDERDSKILDESLYICVATEDRSDYEAILRILRTGNIAILTHGTLRQTYKKIGEIFNDIVTDCDNCKFRRKVAKINEKRRMRYANRQKKKIGQTEILNETK